jgi:hypothetical protein
MKLRILNETGHTEMAIATSEVMDHINEHATHWVFADCELDTTTLYDRMRLQKNYQGKTYTNMVTVCELTNLLSKNKMFEKCKHGSSSNNALGNVYEIAVWKLSKKDK